MPSSTAGLSDMPSEPLVDAEQSTSGSEPAIARAWPPDPNERIAFSVAGDRWEVPWGRHDEFGTAAYWIDQTRKSGYADDDDETMDLKTATVWGLLHGYGVVAEVANAYLDPVMELLNEKEMPSATEVAEVLAAPTGGFMRYRYPNRRAEFISEAVERLDSDAPPDDPRLLRDYLMRLNGVGPKTAALIESGFRGSSAEVHVNDIWLRRALMPAGVFRAHWAVSEHYGRFEAAFLQYARHGGVLPAHLDWCIWELAREAGSKAFEQPG